ncbi:hypothetical protein M2118_000002 [Aurantimicrobium minutum]|uniref:hypothetical protein n=1 Tax=Aurantimicrobium minutum TaxID=708131 RepID=UPI002475EAE3|nr:hypothetical protein [Aurantimicrobium minutum]MDH6277051.1 hypothetical protein [Aurantimicrobium minutum]
MRLSRPHMARVIALLALCAGIGIGNSFGIVAPASATTCDSSPSTFVDLQSAFAAATSAGTTICLGATISGPTNDVVTGGNLTIPAAANVTLDLSGFDLSVTAIKTPTTLGNWALAGITVPSDSTFQIDATGGGSLTVTGATNGITGGAGIGGDSNSYAQSNQIPTTGNITINGGVINAQGGNWSAAIGGGSHRKAGNITINGGTVTATAGSGGSAIGGGWSRSGGVVTINGGTIVATAGGSGTAAIGGGWSGQKVKSFIMTGGSLTTLPSPGSYGMIVGGSGEGTFDMSGGTLDVVGSPAIYFIGATNTLSGGTVTATAILSNSNALWIGYPVASTLNVTGGSLTATSFGTTSAAIRSWNSSSSVLVPSSGGTVLNAGSGFGSGAGAAYPIGASLVGSYGSFSMAGTVDATATSPAQVIIQFGVSSPSSGSSLSLAPSSSLGSTGGTTVSGSTHASTPEVLAATGNNVPFGVIGLLFGLGTLCIFVARRS